MATHRPDAPSALVTLIDTALATDPDQRFASCAELSAALMALAPVGTRPSPPPPPPPKPQPTPKPATRRRWHGPALLHGEVVHPLDSDAVSCGSSADCDIVIDHPSVSPLHCVFEHERGRWGVRDQRSTLGTLVGGALALGRTLLRPGQTVTVGQVDLVFRGD